MKNQQTVAKYIATVLIIDKSGIVLQFHTKIFHELRLNCDEILQNAVRILKLFSKNLNEKIIKTF
ncbi:MAG: hypothetical protein A2Y10_05420 [Planctomycetes bacterium GWF2_41_51]|nr:MAG: hypothetical protein A2Y10_05420 [Planctomycetes bacterium GWF2_41_51]HBG26802.1 hypothetical protein [Phycisphaerales bacterium]